jgi:hypothetical protein
MVRCNTFSKVLLILLMISQFNGSLTAPMIGDELIISNGNHKIHKIRYNQPYREPTYNQYPNNYENTDSSYEDLISLKQDLVNEAQKVTEDMIMENLKENKAYVEYIVESQQQQPEIIQRRQFANRTPTKKQKILFKADKNLKRVEKKSWKIPMKTIALYTENSHSGQNMMDELTEAFNSFKNSGRR